jgi:hypothetical protein
MYIKNERNLAILVLFRRRAAQKPSISSRPSAGMERFIPIWRILPARTAAQFCRWHKKKGPPSSARRAPLQTFRQNWFTALRPQPLPLWRGLFLWGCRRRFLLRGFPAGSAQQCQGVLGIEREAANGLLAPGAQGDVHALVVGQPHGQEIPHESLFFGGGSSLNPLRSVS